MSRTCSSRLRGPVALPLLASLALLACATLSVERERELGDEFAREIRREVVLVRDEVVLSYLDRMGREILAVAGPQPFEYRFNVVDDPDINAFAAPAGHIYMHTGTILQARNASELCGVLAHEIGHVARRHIANNYNRQRWTRVGQQAVVLGAGVLGGQNAAGAANLFGGLAAMSYLNTFGREAEREADAFAVKVMPRAGYDPEGLVTFFHTLKNQGGASPPAFLSSHPATDERIQNTRRMIAAQPLPPGLRSHDGGRFEIVQHRVRLLTGAR